MFSHVFRKHLFSRFDSSKTSTCRTLMLRLKAIHDRQILRDNEKSNFMGLQKLTVYPTPTSLLNLAKSTQQDEGLKQKTEAIRQSVENFMDEYGETKDFKEIVIIQDAE